MKKIAGTIAMILVVMMLGNSFTGCTFMLPSLFSEGDIFRGIGLTMVGLLIDVLIIYFFAGGGAFLAESPDEAETGIYLTKAENNPLTEYYSLMGKLNSLTEEEWVSLMDKINCLPEAKRASLLRTFNSLPETEIASSIQRLNALSVTELASTLQTFKSLSETEMDSLADKFNERVNSPPETEYVAAVNVSREKAHSGLRFQY